MAMYTSVQSVISLGTKIGSFTNVTSADWAGFIEDAGREIDARLSKRYALPFSPVPPILITIASNLAMYEGLQRIFVDDSPSISEWVDRFWSRANSLLGAIEDGNVLLVTSAGAVVAASTTNRQVLSATKGYKPVFDMRDPMSQVVDSDRIDDEDSE